MSDIERPWFVDDDTDLTTAQGLIRAIEDMRYAHNVEQGERTHFICEILKFLLEHHHRGPGDE